MDRYSKCPCSTNGRLWLRAEKINDMRKASVEELAPFIDIPEDASAICRAQIIGL